MLETYLDPEFILQSRVHRLQSYITSSENRRIFLKRDDELGAGISGSKYRKYASLLHHLIKHQYDEVIVIGSAQSNNVLALVMLLKERNIRCRLMLLEGHTAKLQGNLLWLSMLHPLREVIWIKRQEWPGVDALADAYAARKRSLGRSVFVIREGAAVKEALPGAISLANDIVRNEREHHLAFDHIFIDSGTGTMASGLLLGMSLAQSSGKTVHITLIAGDEPYFRELYLRLKKELSEWTGLIFPSFMGNIVFHKPIMAPSFGSVNTQVLDEVRSIAIMEGILAEPVYTAKHLATARHIIESENLNGKILIINSGGSLGLSGFQDKLRGE